ncbi:hypothetical protein Ciccas_014371, partial [Cichlidogyrus casuarinus]
EIESLFKQLDKSGDGKISVDEFIALAEANNEKMDQAAVKEFIDKYDSDRDGTISLDELRAFFQHH